MCTAIMFAAGAVFNLIIILLGGKNVWAVILLTAALIGCMHGGNLMMTCMVPPFFERYGRSSTVSGILNAFVYIGSAISTFGIAVLSQDFGWRFTLKVWLAAGLFGMLICLVCAVPWRKQYSSEK